jgi:hypothetical protein
MYKYPNLEGEEPPPSWVTVLRAAEAWGVHPDAVVNGSARWYLRWVIDRNAYIKANKKQDG